MSPENNQKLIESYPEIFAHVRYCSVGDGWFDLINNACNMIQNHLRENKQVPQLVAMQIKEKFGELRFYYNGGDQVCDQIIENIQSSSTHICDVCGTSGELRTDRGWLRTLCDEHAK